MQCLDWGQYIGITWLLPANVVLQIRVIINCSPNLRLYQFINVNIYFTLLSLSHLLDNCQLYFSCCVTFSLHRIMQRALLSSFSFSSLYQLPLSLLILRLFLFSMHSFVKKKISSSQQVSRETPPFRWHVHQNFQNQEFQLRITKPKKRKKKPQYLFMVYLKVLFEVGRRRNRPGGRGRAKGYGIILRVYGLRFWVYG